LRGEVGLDKMNYSLSVNIHIKLKKNHTHTHKRYQITHILHTHSDTSHDTVY